MEKVIQRLIHNHPHAHIFLFGGGKDETPVMNDWADKYPQLINASSHLNGLKQELILISHLHVMVSMDSANMHLASLVNTPVVSIWELPIHTQVSWAGIRILPMPYSLTYLAALAVSMVTSLALGETSHV